MKINNFVLLIYALLHSLECVRGGNKPISLIPSLESQPLLVVNILPLKNILSKTINVTSKHTFFQVDIKAFP